MRGTPRQHAKERKPPEPRANDGAYGGQVTMRFLFFAAGLVSLLPFTCSVGAAANITAAQSGLWNSGGTWSGPVPGVGDTVNIPDGVTVTVADIRTIGTSGPSGTVAIAL